MSEIEPVTREEVLLNSISEGSDSEIKPITRREMYLSAIAGETDLPADMNPITREEIFLQKVLDNGTGGGGKAENDAIANVLKIIGNEAFRYETLPEIVNFKKLTSVGTRAFANVKGCKVLVLPAVTYLNTFPFSDSATITTIDLGAYSGGITQYSFSGNTNFDTLILRSSPNCTLATINAFDGTPFASGRTGGKLYVPQTLISTYQSASNWSTILGYTNNQILPIEGSIYETQYADGTPILS